MNRSEILKALEEYAATLLNHDHSQGVVILVVDSSGVSVSSTSNVNFMEAITAAVEGYDVAKPTYNEYGPAN